MTPQELSALAAAMLRDGAPFREGDVAALLTNLPGVLAEYEAMRRNILSALEEPLDAMRAGRGKEGA